MISAEGVHQNNKYLDSQFEFLLWDVSSVFNSIYKLFDFLKLVKFEISTEILEYNSYFESEDNGEVTNKENVR